MSETLRLQEKLFVIDQMPVFTDLSIGDKNLVAGVSSILEYKKDDIVYSQGDPPDAFYCVVSGRLKAYITKDSGGGDLEYIKRGKYFGIISVLTGENHSATVRVINDSVLLKISKDDFDKLLKQIPELAIHLGQTLSRRLKRKDLHEKRVFESTIISIFGTASRIGATNYALNLASGLKFQTGKKVIILDIGTAGEDLSRLLGIDMMSVPCTGDVKKDASHIIPLLSYLTNDYHYVLVDLASNMDKLAFEVMKQSDMVQFVTVADESSLHLTAKMVEELEKSAPGMAAKIKVITSEYGLLKLVDFENRRAILKHDVFATLPDIDKAKAKIDKAKAPISTYYPDCEYSRAIRRIARDVGECFIGLALGCGASIGLAHIGILKVIEREKIPIDIVVGTSMGAIIGALWAAGKTAGEIEEIISLFKMKIKTFSLMDLTFPRMGLVKGRQVKKFLRSQLKDMTFYDLKLPFKVIACDIEKREEVVIDKGSIVDALSASIAIPGLFEPVKIGGRLLVDGGIVNPLATNVLMRMGIPKIIAVNALPSPEDIQKSKKRMSNIADVMVNSIQASEYLLAEISCQGADIAMHPVVPTVEWYEFYESEKVIKRGEEEALKYLPQLKELAAS